jgi:flagellar motility protein MotE (MotC chaperone)
MKKLLMVGVTSLLLFGISAAASYFWQQKQKSGHDGESEHAEAHKETAKGKAKTDEGEKDHSNHHSSSASPPRAASRPAYNPGTEEIARMTNELRTRLAAVREREEQLSAQKKQIDLIHEDIRGERSSLDELRTQIQSEMDALNEAIQGVEKQRGSLEEERQKIDKNAKEMEGRVMKLEKEEHENLKKMSGMYNSMTPESAAKILQNLADTGKMDTAVKILGTMQERQAAKVLTELTDQTLAAQLVEKLRGLRRTPANPEGTRQ